MHFLIHSRLVWYQCVSRSTTTSYLQAWRSSNGSIVTRSTSNLSVSPCQGMRRSSRFIICSKQRGQQRSAPNDSPMRRVTSAMGSSLVDEAQRPREQPGQAFAEAVAPVLPVVPVASLDEAHLHAGGREQRHHRAVLVDERLVNAAAEEDALAHGLRLGAVGVDELDHPVEERPAAVALADVGESERAGLEQQPSPVPGMAPGGGEGGHRAEARAHQ